jgi:exonuclease III
MSEKNQKIATINVRSIKNLEKIFYLKDLIEKNSIDIVFIQETHLDNKEFYNKICDVFKNYKVLCPILNDSYKGVGILVKNSVQYKNIKVEIIERERIMCLQVNFYDNIINLIRMTIILIKLTLLITYMTWSYQSTICVYWVISIM